MGPILLVFVFVTLLVTLFRLLLGVVDVNGELVDVGALDGIACLLAGFLKGKNGVLLLF